MFEEAVCTFDKVIFDQKLSELKSRVEPHLLDVVKSFELNLPSDDKQKIEDSFDGPLFHQLLSLCDHLQSNFLHPNDKRKIVNALFSFLKDSHTSHSKPKLRFLPVLVWVSATKDIL